MFAARLAEIADRVGSHLDNVLAPMGDLPVIEAMRYASRGGKRLRAFLVVETAALHGVAEARALWPAAAVEALHASSLIHDDLPAMDDDGLRRGLPTVHVKWDEATAILAGDALQALAFDLVARPETHPDPAIRLTLIQGLARAAGALGMVRGQAQDIAAETAATPLTLAQITDLQANKTGALIRWSATAGAHLVGADPAPLAAYADALGLAFQIADDILDIEGDPAKTGKALRKDEAAGKATFVSLLGLDGARARARSLVDEAESALAPYGPAAQTLRHAARFVISRET
jgi:farnesyl diphosphate synthase